MRKTWSMILALTMAVSLAGCSSGGNGTKETPSTATQETEGTVQTEASEESQEAEYVLNLGDVLAEDHPHSQSYYWFADRVKELT